MLTPSIFGENLFDDWFDDFPFFDDRDLRKVDKKLYGRRAGNLMNRYSGDEGWLQDGS